VDAVTGVITTVAGTGAEGYAGDGGPAAGAVLFSPDDVAVDAAGNLFIADSGNHRVRRVDTASGVISTVAGSGAVGGYGGDGGPAAAARLSIPFAVAVDAAGDLFIADTFNQRIRRVDAVTGVITTVAGTGAVGYGGDGLATSALLAYPEGVAVDAAGNLFIANAATDRVGRVDAATGAFTTVVGAGYPGYGGDGGPARIASLTRPYGLAVDPAGNLFIVDQGNQRVRRVGSGAVVGGSPTAYTITIRNTSPAITDPVTVTSIAVDRLGELIDVARAANGGADVVLAPGQGFRFSATGAADGPPVTTVTVTAHDDEGTRATATVAETVTVP
jgi:sugar lactone lactonase YvrE